jgi:hypothetical protein
MENKEFFLKTVEESFNELYKIAKDRFELADLKLSKISPLGFLIYSIAYISEDSKRYYDWLYNNAFISTANEYSALMKIGALFGYKYQTASAAEFIGNIRIILPSSEVENQSNIKIHIPYGTQFVAEEIIFTLLADLEIKVDTIGKNVIGFYYNPINSKYLTVIGKLDKRDNKSYEIVIPAREIYQLRIIEKEIVVPNYPFGTFYKIDISKYYDKSTEQLNKLFVYVKDVSKGADASFEEYKIDVIEIQYGSDDKVVFLDQIDRNKYVIRLGNGIYGYKIPENSIVKLVMWVTKGSSGNISANSVFKVNLSSTSVTVNDRLITSSEVVQIVSTKDTSSGVDIKSLDEIRKELLKTIRTKETVVSEIDYIEFVRNSVKSETYKISYYDPIMCGNIVKIFTPLLDDVGRPFKTVSLSPSLKGYDEEVIYNPELIYTTSYKTFVDTSVIVTQDNVKDTDTIPVSDASVFTAGDIIKFENSDNTYEIKSADTNNNTIVLTETLNSTDVLNNGTKIYKWDNEKIPVVSPFIYVRNVSGNSYFVYYDRSEFDNVGFNITDLYNNNYIIPSVKFYSKVSKIDLSQSKIFLDIRAQIDNFYELNYSPEFKLKIEDLEVELNEENGYKVSGIDITNILPGNNIYEKLKYLSDNGLSFSVVINNSDTTEELVFGHSSKNLRPIKDVSDFISPKIKTNPETGENHIIHVPFISKDELETYNDYLRRKIDEFFDKLGRSEYRLPGADISFGLPNTIEIQNPADILEPQSNNNDKCSLEPVKLPIKPKIVVSTKKEYRNDISKNTLLNELKITVAKFLKDKNSFTQNFKHSDLINLIKTKYKDLIDDVRIIQPSVNIVGKKRQEENIKTEIVKTSGDPVLKDKLIKFTPVYVHFDLDADIEVV